MKVLKSVKRYHLTKDGSGWYFTIKPDGTVWGSIHHKGVVHGFEFQEMPELYSELKSLMQKIPRSTVTEPERILVIGVKDEDDVISLNDFDNYAQDSPESSLWRRLESLAVKIVGNLSEEDE